MGEKRNEHPTGRGYVAGKEMAMNTKVATVYKYRGSEYPTRYEAVQAARDEARSRNHSVKEETVKIEKLKREEGRLDRWSL